MFMCLNRFLTGLDRKSFMARLEEVIETETRKLESVAVI